MTTPWGIWDARERGELRMLEPGETRRYHLEIGGLVGSAEIEAFAGRVERLHPVPA